MSSPPTITQIVPPEDSYIKEFIESVFECAEDYREAVPSLTTDTTTGIMTITLSNGKVLEWVPTIRSLTQENTI